MPHPLPSETVMILKRFMNTVVIEDGLLVNFRLRGLPESEDQCEPIPQM